MKLDRAEIVKLFGNIVFIFTFPGLFENADCQMSTARRVPMTARLLVYLKIHALCLQPSHLTLSPCFTSVKPKADYYPFFALMLRRDRLTGPL